MQIDKLQEMKLKRAISWQGKDYIFKRKGLNKYKEEDESASTEVKLRGLYHETTNYIDVRSGDGSKLQKKYSPMILALTKDASQLKVDDTLTINGSLYKVADVHDMSHFHIVSDISLEVVR